MAGEAHFGLIDTIGAVLLLWVLPVFAFVVGMVLLLKRGGPANMRVLGAGAAAVGPWQVFHEVRYMMSGCTDTPGGESCDLWWASLVAGWTVCGLITAVTLAFVAHRWIRRIALRRELSRFR